MRNDIYEFLLDEICFLREEIVLKNKIIKSLFTVESISLDDQTFTHKVERTKNDQKKKKNCRSFINTSDNPQGDINQRDIINFNIDKVIKELKDSLNCDNL